MEALNGKKTHLAVIAGLVASIALFVQAGDYSLNSILHLFQGDAFLAAISFLRMAFAKNGK